MELVVLAALAALAALAVLAAFAALAALAASISSNSLHEGAQTAWDLPNTFLVVINERARCLPQRKQDMVAPPKEAAAIKGDPDTLDLYRSPSGRTVVFDSVFAM